jgi:hypothetical protein
VPKNLFSKYGTILSQGKILAQFEKDEKLDYEDIRNFEFIYAMNQCSILVASSKSVNSLFNEIVRIYNYQITRKEDKIRRCFVFFKRMTSLMMI